MILACDGFGANQEMLRRFIPEMAGVEYIGTQNNTGEGIRWGVELGAATAHMSGYQGHGYVCAGYGTRLAPEIPQPGGVAFGIFDQRIYDVVAHTDHFRDTVASGALRTAGTPETLAAALRLDPAGLRATVEEYNTGALAHTQGGLKVDVHARVLRPEGAVIPNLYAGGGTAAGISGNGPGGYLSGNGLLSALGLGLIAGEHAAAELRSAA